MEHRLRILGREGHVETMWRPEAPETVAPAKEKFDELTRMGYLAFVATPQTKEQIREFDPLATEILLVPRYVGG